MVFVFLFFFFFLHSNSLSLVGDQGRLPWVRPQELHEQCGIPIRMSCVRTIVWMPVFGIFTTHTHTDSDACSCTWGLYKHCKWVCAENWLWKSNPHQYCTWLFSLMFYQLSYPAVLILPTEWSYRRTDGQTSLTRHYFSDETKKWRQKKMSPQANNEPIIIMWLYIYMHWKNVYIYKCP